MRTDNHIKAILKTSPTDLELAGDLSSFINKSISTHTPKAPTVTYLLNPSSVTRRTINSILYPTSTSKSPPTSYNARIKKINVDSRTSLSMEYSIIGFIEGTPFGRINCEIEYALRHKELVVSDTATLVPSPNERTTIDISCNSIVVTDNYKRHGYGLELTYMMYKLLISKIAKLCILEPTIPTHVIFDVSYASEGGEFLGNLLSDNLNNYITTLSTTLSTSLPTKELIYINVGELTYTPPPTDPICKIPANSPVDSPATPPITPQPPMNY